ncbi:polysaccharide biosynthesis tyrosine autokinase [Sediminitomix flava]|uniref:Capsular exopolysaccharide synthesis family protein n=1 Tax=Sediminitomix flava TaxID=379075 RepID=A0A315Z0A0_SEDFL|nr:tyrosine-protein kinase [Sediminitomix flava]PWJ36097.1 capsular exopolysaccharide synthesis family protein [Sediminitomix flava]
MAEEFDPWAGVEEQTEERSNTEFDFEKLLFVLRKNILWSILIIGMGIVGGYLFLRWTPKVYEASTLLKMEIQSTRKLFGLEMPSVTGSMENVNLAGEMELIKSPMMYESVLDSLDLSISYFSEGEVQDTELYGSLPFVVSYKHLGKENSIFYDQKIHIEFLDEENFVLTFNEFSEIQTINGKFNQPFRVYGTEIILQKTKSLESLGHRKYNFVFNSKNKLFQNLRQNLSVNVENARANTLRINYQANNRSKSIDVLEAFNKNYIVKTIENKNVVYERSLQYLKNQQATIEDSLRKYETEYRSYTRIENVPEFAGLEDIVSKIRELEQQKLEIRLTKSQYDEIIKLIDADSSTIYLEAVGHLLGNQQIASMINNVLLVEQDLDRVKGSYTKETHARNQRREALLESRSKLKEVIIYSLGTINRQIDNLDQEVLKLEKAFYGSIGGDPVLKNIEKNFRIYEEMTSLIASKMIELNIAKSGTVENFQVLSQPNADIAPVFPQTIMVYGVGIGSGVFLSLLLIVLSYLLHTRIDSVKQVERISNLPILGYVPHYSKEDMNYSQLVVQKRPKASISEAFRSIRTNIDFMNVGEEQKVLSVTSTISGEGKTFVAANIAGVIAMSGAKVALLDVDLRKPKIHFAFGNENLDGLSSVLIGKSNLKDVLRSSPIATMKYVTAGPVPPNPSELIMSKGFSAVINQLKEEFDVIVLDTPPVGAVTDGMIAMRHVDLPIYVVRAEYSKTSFVENANELSKSKKIKNLALVVNDVYSRTLNYGNYYGNNYSYGYGGYNGYGYYDENDISEKWWKRFFS